MRVLVPNLGSTSLKYQILEMPAERVLTTGRVERVEDYRAAIHQIPTGGSPVDVVAFKAVHGGPDYRGTFRVDTAVLDALERFLPAAPAHNAIYLTAIRAFGEAFPNATLVAAFETEFHRTIPEPAVRYGVPSDWRGNDGIRRYGFHGASHQYVSEHVPALLGRPVHKLISCHLGGSSSICAIRDGESVDTTMGFSPQSGLENATRHGDLDVFAVLAMMEWHGWTVAEVRDQLARTGGLAGLSGVPGGDLRDIETAAAAGNGDAAITLQTFAYQVRKTIGSYCAAMEGVDTIAFTGGIGENSASLRQHICGPLRFLGVHLHPERNVASGDRVVSSDSSEVVVVALRTNEELIVARRAYRLLASP